MPKFTDLLHLSPFEAGLLAAIPSLTGSLLRIPFGAAVDHFGGKRPLLALLPLTNVGVVGLLRSRDAPTRATWTARTR